MQGYALRPVAAGLRLELLPGERAVPPALEPAVAAAWAAAQARAGGRLFNGRVFSVESASAERLTGRLVEYRQVVAGFSDPALAAALEVRPLSVCGVLRTAEGVVFGRRSKEATYEAGLWQMPPAGSVDAGAVRDGAVDAEAALRAELAEELGLGWEAVTACRPFALVEHLGSGVRDLGFLLDTALGFAAVAAAAAARGNGEYQELVAVPEAELAGWLAARPGRVVPAAGMFLGALGLV
ncbi:NUDIX domain-containing protein [Siccirubricoccus phaeus]|uniref:NUDIX domain-containing protein n=1 Tax=Siccirubricoccus phaeus TaxID=2595053 RepID=UPI0011F39D69|nr:NUDIX domain-containing protein [Siccirubricoccus phaeus]